MPQVAIRKDIQALRGIAVALVVLFHLGFIKGGFLGVDVFFAVSGYLMAQLYDPAAKLDFYARRARRLLPAYFATVVATLLGALAITVPSDFSQVVTQSQFATIFASNIGFWVENSYFDKSNFRPLLHLWSLGIEIQFYLLLPLFAWFLARLRSGFVLALLGSLGLCSLVLEVSPQSAFFWLPTRLWEFLVGFGLAKYWHGRNQPWIGVMGLIVIVCIPFLGIDGRAAGFALGHPGLAALLICLATGLVLAMGIPKRVEEFAVPLVRLGDYSYSVYLAHFPIIVLFLYQPMSGTILKAQSAWQTCALFLLMVLGSALLFRYVERPFRKVVPKPGWSFPVAVITVLALGPIGVMVEKATIPASEMVIHEAFTDRADFRCPRSHRVLHPTATSCELTGLPNPRRRILLVGDSHAESIKTAFAEAAKQANVAVHFLVANNPLMPGGLTARELVEEATTLHADAIVMHYLTHGVDFNAVREMAASARAQHISAAFIMPVPVWDRSVPIALLDRTLPRQDIADYRRQNADLIEAITSVDFPVYQTAETLCTPECQSLVDGHPAYFDNSHLTLSGARLLRGLFDQVIADLPAHEGEFTQDGEPKKTI